MPFTVYILYAPSIDQYYIGHTADLEGWIYRHTHAGSKATKKATDWNVVYKEVFSTKSEAYKREMEIKKKKSRVYIKTLIGSAG